MNPWKITELEEEEEEEFEDQEFTYQNPILENLEIETPNFQIQPNLDNSENDIPNIQTPPNQNNSNLNTVPTTTTTSIITATTNGLCTYLKKTTPNFTVKPQNFNGFKTEFLWYFSNNNNINKLANTFTTIRQEDTEAILNQFIRRLHSSILQQVCPMHPVDLPTTVTYTRDFEAAELEANHTQAVNLAINRSSELDSKLKQFRNTNCFQNQSRLLLSSNQLWQPEMHICYNCVPDSEPLPESRPIPTHLLTYDASTNLSTASLSNSSLSTATTSNLLGTATSNISTAATSNLSNTHYSNTTSKLSSNDIREPKIEDHPKLEISNSCTLTDSQLFLPTIRILSVEFGYWFHPKPEFPILFKPSNAIFPFELEEPSDMLLFSRAALEEKLITAMYTDAKVNGHFIKLILDNDQLGCRVNCTASARIITANEAIKTPIGKIDDFPIEVNGIIVLIKVLTTQELVLSQNSRHMRVPATCGHFKATNTTASLIDLEKKNQNLLGKHIKSHGPMKNTTNNNGKGKQKRTEPIWNRWDKREKEKKKRRKRSHYQLPVTPLIHIYYHNYQAIVDQSLYALIVAKNCHQWAPAVAMMRNTRQQLSFIAVHALSNALEDQNKRGTCDETCQIASVKAEDATTSKLLEIKNNPLSLPESEYVLMFHVFGNIKDNLEEFHEHYQQLAPTQKEQEQWLEEINT
ncbi:hypothetical protein G9A89_010279 [Geosiphon pyriformis]|nr:hypothetical protein G9A89_010279 [Geosiphon pyriformis]